MEYLFAYYTFVLDLHPHPVTSLTVKGFQKLPGHRKFLSRRVVVLFFQMNSGANELTQHNIGVK